MDGQKPRDCLGFVTAECATHTYDIFEGTEQIQQLVIARALSGMRIE